MKIGVGKSFSWALVRGQRMNNCWRTQKEGKEIAKTRHFCLMVGNANRLSPSP
jgi:hypothetical protein